MPRFRRMQRCGCGMMTFGPFHKLVSRLLNSSMIRRGVAVLRRIARGDAWAAARWLSGKGVGPWRNCQWLGQQAQLVGVGRQGEVGHDTRPTPRCVAFLWPATVLTQANTLLDPVARSRERFSFWRNRPTPPHGPPMPEYAVGGREGV
jgi:hypothetical protein